MEFTKDSPLLRQSSLTEEELYAAFEPMTPAGQLANMRRACRVIVERSRATGFDPFALAAIGWIETGSAVNGLPFRAPQWVDGYNFGNLGITGDADQNAAAQTWANATDGTIASAAHLVAYAYGKDWRDVWNVDDDGDPRLLDKRFDLAIGRLAQDGIARAVTFDDLNRRWAVDKDDDDYGGKLAARATILSNAVEAYRAANETPAQPPAESETEMIPVYSNILSTSASNRPGRKLGDGELWIVVHETDNPNAGADADNQIDYIHSAEARSRQASYHLSVDDKQIAQGLPLDEIGWHAGDGCDDPQGDIGCFKSVAIERCVNAGRNEDQNLRNLAELIARIVHGDPRLNWGGGGSRGRFSADRITTHQKVSNDNKYCPQIILSKGYWPKLMTYVDEAEVRLYGDGGTTPLPPAVYATPVPALKMETYQVGSNLFIYAPAKMTVQRTTTPRRYAEPDQPPTGVDLVKGDVVDVTHFVLASDRTIWALIKKTKGQTKDGTRIPTTAFAP